MSAANGPEINVPQGQDCRCGSYADHIKWWNEAVRIAQEQGHPYPIVEAHRRHWERTRG